MIKQVFKEQDLPWEDLQKIGLAQNCNLNISDNDRKSLLSGRRTEMLRLKNLSSDGLQIPYLDARLSLKPDKKGTPELLVHPIYKMAEKPSFLTDSEAEKLKKGEALNIDRMIFDDEGKARDILVEFDRETNEFIVIDQHRILAPDRVNGEYLSLDQKERYRKGKEVELKDGTKFQYSGTDSQAIRSNKLALIASILIDGGLSFALYHGLNALFGEKRNKEDEDVYSKGYYNDLEELQKQQQGQQSRVNTEKEYSRGYSRSGSR